MLIVQGVYILDLCDNVNVMMMQGFKDWLREPYEKDSYFLVWFSAGETEHLCLCLIVVIRLVHFSRRFM